MISSEHGTTEPSHDPSGAPLVSVCICTFKRLHVAQTVLSILEQRGIDGLSYEIIVCDDDKDASAAPIMAKLTTVAPLVRYVVSGASNVALARNRCLQEARGALIAFVDDDQVADPHWLECLLRTQATYRADIVKGYVRGVYPQGTPGWVRAADPFTRDYGPTGSKIDEGATGNVLFRRALYTRTGLAFDPAYGTSGGEDSDFFRRATACGATMIACREAIVDEIVPPHRVGLRYLADKALRIGETAGCSSRTGAFGTKRTLDETARAIAGVALAWIYPALRPTGTSGAYKLMVKFWYSVGLLRGLMGFPARKMA